MLSGQFVKLKADKFDKMRLFSYSYLRARFGCSAFALLVYASPVVGQGVLPVPDYQEDPFSVPHSTESVESLQDKVDRLRAELMQAEEELSLATGSIGAAQQKETVSSAYNDIPTGALVVISGAGGSGSGFMASIKGREFLVTNIHVLGAARDATFTTIEGVNVKIEDAAFLSRHRDIAIVPVEWSGPVLSLSPSLSFDEVKIGQSITVMGNSSGANVATRLTGEIQGIGPTELEVSAKFVPGNSGSPIVHDALGTVVAVASHLKDYSSDSKWTENTEFDKIRRFGYRLDGEINWEQISLSDLFDQGEVYEKFESRTAAMWNISYMLLYESKLVTSYRDDESIGHLYDDISSDFNWGRGTASSHNIQMLRRFLNGMMSEVQSDIYDTDEAISTGFYRKRFNSIRGYRDQIRNNLSRFSESRL